VRALLLAQGVPAPLVRRAAIACYEAELNVVMYARNGQIRLTLFPDRIKVEVEDSGPGILDIEMALREGFSTASPAFRDLGFGAGMGLPNIRSMVDQFTLMSEPGSGTVLWFDVLIPPPAGGAEEGEEQ
jgi:anti-sigma regulatory factor (Ser/Thr protein kinase)